MSWLHNATHKHASGHKDGVGGFHVCLPRYLAPARFFFRPDFEGADWHEVGDPEVIQEMLKTTSAHEAMALLRRSR